MDTIIGIGITVLLMACLVGFAVFSSQSFSTLFNYVDLDDTNRIAMDQLTRDVRQSNKVKTYATNRLELEDSDGLSLVYEYSPTARTLTRTKNGADPRVMLTQCDRLIFSIGQRNTQSGSYNVFPAATAATAKVVNVSWSCSRKLMGVKHETESVQTARIVIRKQGA